MKPLIRDLRRQEVSPLELLFDLVYAFAISQLARHLLTHQSWTGAAETLVLYLAVYTAWGYTAWAGNLVNTEHPRARRMLVVVMVLSMFMNASITRAFDDAGWVFVTGYLLIHVGRIAWLLTIGLDPVQQRHFTRTLIWIVTTSPLWIAGAATEHRTRLALWGLAAVIDLTGTVTAHPLFGRRLDSRRLTFATAHIGERCRLFLLVALGETILTTGAALVNAHFSPRRWSAAAWPWPAPGLRDPPPAATNSGRPRIRPRPRPIAVRRDPRSERRPPSGHAQRYGGSRRDLPQIEQPPADYRRRRSPSRLERLRFHAESNRWGHGSNSLEL